jgi:hypothetical protein
VHGRHVSPISHGGQVTISNAGVTSDRATGAAGANGAAGTANHARAAGGAGGTARRGRIDLAAGP